MKKRNLIIANWKMNPTTLAEATKMFSAMRLGVTAIKGADVLVCPPVLYLPSLLRLRAPKNLFLGAQNIATEEKGAFTGEISAPMIKNLGIKFTLVGHSERRALGETNQIVKKKMQMAFDHDLSPVLCIGETIRDKEGSHLSFLKTQIMECLSGLPKKNLIGLTIAYEPVWAIGRSYADAMDPTDIHEMTLFIKKVAGEIFGKDVGGSFKILYGGSVEPENVKAIVEYGDIDGFLVGHASLVPEQFSAILKAADLKK